MLVLSVPSPQFISFFYLKREQRPKWQQPHTHTKDLFTFQSNLQCFLSPAVSGSLFTPKVKSDLESVCLCGCVRVFARYSCCHSFCRDLICCPVTCCLYYLLQKEMKLVWWTVWWKLYSLEQPSVTGGKRPHATVPFHRQNLIIRHVASVFRAISDVIMAPGFHDWYLSLHTILRLCLVKPPVWDWIWWPVSVVSFLPLLFYCHHHCRWSESFQSSLSVAGC